MASSTSASGTPQTFTPVADLLEHADATIKVMVCRSWDVKNPSGKYIGTEYIVCDDAGVAIHCVARSSIAHCVVGKLHVGGIYNLRRFTVSANKSSYRLRRNDPHLINLESNTLIQKLDCSDDGFLHHPFVLAPLEEITFTNNEYLIDVIGRPVCVGDCKPTRNGSQLLDFYLTNERGFSVKVTLWGGLGDELLRLIGNADALTVVLLPAMIIREYKGEIQLSSSSGTLLFVGDEIPEIAALRALMRNSGAPIQRNYGTLLHILQVGRAQTGLPNAPTVTTVCKVKIAGIRARTPWNYYSCGEKGCKKGVSPSGAQFWCDSCEKICEFPVVRFLLRLEVLDDTTSLVVTLFDEVAEALVKKSASSVLAASEGLDEEQEYPDEVRALIGTCQEVELKSHTYYNHGQYESFTVTRVLPPLNPQNQPSDIPPPAQPASLGKDSVVAAEGGNAVTAPAKTRLNMKGNEGDRTITQANTIPNNNDKKGAARREGRKHYSCTAPFEAQVCRIGRRARAMWFSFWDSLHPTGFHSTSVSVAN